MPQIDLLKTKHYSTKSTTDSANGNKYCFLSNLDGGETPVWGIARGGGTSGQGPGRVSDTALNASALQVPINEIDIGYTDIQLITLTTGKKHISHTLLCQWWWNWQSSDNYSSNPNSKEKSRWELFLQ